MRYLTLLAVAGLILTVTATAGATTFWMDPVDLSNMGFISSTPPGGSSSPVGWVQGPPGRPTFKYQGTFGGQPIGWSAVQVGYQWSPPGVDSMYSYNGKMFPDLSGYDDFRMSFHNQGDEPVKVNLWLNTGWTDPGEDDTFAQARWYPNGNGWTELGYCDWVDIVLEFDNADMYVNGVYVDGGSITNLHHVTGIGFTVATEAGSATWSVDVDTIPEPMTMLAVGMGIAGLAGYIRKRKMA